MAFKFRRPPKPPVRTICHYSICIDSVGRNLAELYDTVARACSDAGVKFDPAKVKLKPDYETYYLEFEYPEAIEDFNRRQDIYNKQKAKYDLWVKRNKDEIADYHSKLAAKAEARRRSSIKVKKRRMTQLKRELTALEKELHEADGD